MTILGIDPGIARCGWGVIENQNSKIEMQNCGCIETISTLKMEERLFLLHQELEKIIKKYKPDALALEDLFFNTNAKTAFIVGQARGIVLLAGGEHNLDVAVYTPLQVKIAVTGYGRAEKSQVEKMVQILLKLKTMPKLDDTVDALAIAITHAHSHRSV